MKKTCTKLYNAFLNKISNNKCCKSKKMFNRSNSEMPLSEDGVNKKRSVRAHSLHELDIAKANADSGNVIEELLQCGICYDRLLDPRMLLCQHTFCLSCLQGHMKSVTERMMKKRHSPPSAEEVKTIMDKIPIPLPCSTCQRVTNVNYGLESLKDLPKNIHIENLLKLMPSSCTSPTSTSPSLRCIKCQTICKLPGKSCGHCMQIFCSVCWTEHLSTLKSNITTLLEHLSESETKLKNRIDEFNMQCQNISVDIEKATKNKILKLKEKEQNSLQQLEEIKKSEDNHVKGLQNRIEKISEEIKLLKFDEIGNEDHKVNTFMNYHRTTSKILDDISHWGDIQLIFDENSFKVTKNHMYLDEADHISSIAEENPFESVENMVSYYENVTFKTKLIWNKCPRPAGVGICPWAPHLLYIATTTRKVVLIMDRSASKVISKLITPDMHCPQGIAFSHQRLEVYVTDKWKHCIHVFDNEGKYLRTLCNLGSGKGELRSPEGIAVTQDNHLVVCDSGNDRVVIVNAENGQQLSLLSGNEYRTPFRAPTGVAVFGDRIIVSDTGNHNIKVYTNWGKIIHEFGNIGSGRGQFRTAEVVACDPMGFIFVGDSGNARIQIFTPDGEFVKECTGKTTEKFLWISGLAVSPQLEMITTDYKQRCLQIFNNYS